MKKWFVSIPVYASAFVRVEADTEEQAIEKALQLRSLCLCNQCSDRFEIGDEDQSADITAEEIDE